MSILLSDNNLSEKLFASYKTAIFAKAIKMWVYDEHQYTRINTLELPKLKFRRKFNAWYDATILVQLIVMPPCIAEV